MDLLSPLRLGVHVATDAVKLATAVPRLIIQQLSGGDHAANGHAVNGHAAAGGRPQASAQPVGTPRPDGTPAATPAASGPARGATGRRAPSPRATPGRAALRDPGVEATTSPPEPTSAAGASGGIAGTADAPGDAAAAGAPDPTAATSTRARPIAPRGERRTNDVSPPRARRRQATTPKRSEVDRMREAEREAELAPAELAETEGAAAPSAEIRVEAPWTGYDLMKAPDIVDRVKASDEAVKAVVLLYEQTHKKRKSILDAVGS